MPSINKTETIKLSQYQGNEYQKRPDINEDNLKIDNKFKSVDTSLSEKANNTDNARTTTDKTVTGAINELNTNKANKDTVDILWTGTVHSGTLTLAKDISQYDRLIITVNGLVDSVWYTRTTVLDTYPTTISSPAYVSIYEVNNTMVKMDITGTTAIINGTLVGNLKRITGVKRGV